MRVHYNKKEMMLRYIVALKEIKKNYLTFGKFAFVGQSTRKNGIGAIPRDVLFDITDQVEITEEYAQKVISRRQSRDANMRKGKHAEFPAQTLFAEGNSYSEKQELTEESCIEFLKGKGYQIYKRFC